MNSNIPAYRVTVVNKIFRRVMRPIFRGIFHVLSQVRVIGREFVPRNGAYLIATNHVSLYEPPLVLAFWPRPVEAIGASDIWERPGQSLLARLYSGIPAHRGEIDRQLLNTAISVIRAGHPLLIMPEGGRSHSPGMRRASRGVAYLAEKTGSPIVPVGIAGTTDDYFKRAIHAERPELTMHIGRPFRLPPVEVAGGTRRSILQQNADLVMQHIAALLPPEYHGVYSPVNEVSE